MKLKLKIKLTGIMRVVAVIAAVLIVSVLPVAAVAPASATYTAAALAGLPRTQIRGVDVSRYQGDIDWFKVKDDGISFAIIKVGAGAAKPGGDLQIDEKFAGNIDGALAAGLDVGVYFLPCAETASAARIEAERILRVLEPYSGRIAYPFVLDWEHVNAYGTNLKGYDGEMLSKSVIAEVTNAFLDEVVKANFFPMIYTDADTVRTRFDKALMNDYALWAAYYNVSDTPDLGAFGKSYIMQQYTDAAEVDGIDGAVDLDVAFVDIAKHIKQNGYNTAFGFTSGAGTVPANLRAVYSDTEIGVSWDSVQGQGVRYGVYYCYQKADGGFSEWTVKAVDVSTLIIDTPAHGARYYITVLPFSDVPYRRYGGFAPYAVVTT